MHTRTHSITFNLVCLAVARRQHDATFIINRRVDAFVTPRGGGTLSRQTGSGWVGQENKFVRRHAQSSCTLTHSFFERVHVFNARPTFPCTIVRLCRLQKVFSLRNAKLFALAPRDVPTLALSAAQPHHFANHPPLFDPTPCMGFSLFV
ncbi:unnamed protein product, partial [Protopolystoma xenopodis]